MKGLLVVLVAFVLLPGSVYMLLASNFGALRGYLIAGTAFFGFLVMLSAVWLFGIPGTTPLTGPKGPQPTFVPFTINDPAASTYDSVRDFQGGAGNGWQAAPEGEVEEGSPEADPQGRPGRGAAGGGQRPDRGDQRRHRGLQRGAGPHQPRRQDLLHDPGRHRGGGDRDLAQDPAGGLGPAAARLRPQDQLRLPRPGQPVPAEHPVPDRLDPAVRDPHVPARRGGTAPAPRPDAQTPTPEGARQPAGAGAARG